MRVEGLTESTLRYSAEIRDGQLTREEALTRVVEEEIAGCKDEYIDYFLEYMDISKAEFEKIMSNKFKHMKYQNS